MKKILTLALLSLCFITLRAQNMVGIYGQLTASNGASVESINVHIQYYGDTLNGGFVHNKNVLTNAAGWYSDTMYVPSSVDTGWVGVDINDCKGNNIMKWGAFSNSNGMAPINFEYCSDSIPPPPDSSVAWVYVYGKLHSNAGSVGNVPVHLSAIDNNSSTYQKDVLTDSQGYYADSISFPAGVTWGTLTAAITDCWGQSKSDSRYFGANNNYVNIDFEYCNDTIAMPDSMVSWVYVYGKLSSNGASVSNVPVHLSALGNNSSAYQKDILTDSQGYYGDSISFSTGITWGSVTAEITDCWGQSKSDSRYFDANNNYLNINLEYCADTTVMPDSMVSWVYVYGKISSNNTPIGNVPVHLSAVGNNAFTYQKDLLTNNQGYYGDSIFVTPGVTWGSLTAQITDCWGQSKSDSRYFDAYNNYLNIDFEYCSDTITNPDSLKYRDIEGYVFGPDSSQAPMQDFRVYLIRTYGTNSDTSAFVSDSMDTKMYYKFNNVYDGTYLVKAMLLPGQVSSGKYFPTYYGQTLNWEDALTITRPALSQQYNNIWLLHEPDSISGTGQVSGKVVDANEDGINGVQVILANAINNSMVACTTTDMQGHYAFSSMAFDNYKVWAEILGKHHEVHNVEITTAAPISEHNDFKVVGDSILAVQFTTGITDNKTSTNKSIIIPNPATTNATLTLLTDQAAKTTITIYSITGAKMWQQLIDLQSGSQQVELPVNMLEKGVYIIETMNNNIKMINRLVKE